MNAPLFDIDRPSLQAEVESYKPGTGLAWPNFFDLKYTPKFDIHSLVGEDGIPVSADRIAFNVKAPKKTRKTIGSWDGKLAKIAISREKDEMAINEYNDLKAIAAQADTDKDAKQYLVDMVYDDVKFCNDGMDYRVELDAMRIASHGFQSFPASIEGDNATQDVIDFHVPDDNKAGASVAWSDVDNADGIADIVALQKKPMKKGNRKPMYCILEQAAFDQLLAQKKTLNRLSGYSALTGSNLVLTQDSVDLAMINRYMTSKGYPTFVVIDTYATVEAKDGSQETIKPFAENVVVMAPTTKLGYVYYKTVPDVKDTAALQSHASYYKVTRYSDLNPMLEVTLAEAYMQVGLKDRASLCFLNTAKTTWNNGDV